LRKDIAKLLDRALGDVQIHRREASGCYGRNCADDVSADAALLAQAVGKSVRVQLMREQEAGWEPKGTGQLIRVRGGVDANHQVAAYELRTSYPSNNAVNLALVLTGVVANQADVQQMGDRTAIPQYEYPHMRVIFTVNSPALVPRGPPGFVMSVLTAEPDRLRLIKSISPTTAGKWSIPPECATKFTAISFSLAAAC